MVRPRIPHRPAGGKKAKVEKSDARQTSIDAPAAPAKMELDGGDSVDFGIMNHLRDLVHAHVKEASEAFDHEEILLKALGEKVGRYVRAVADRAFAAGVHARSSDSASLALGALEHL